MRSTRKRTKLRGSCPNARVRSSALCLRYHHGRAKRSNVDVMVSQRRRKIERAMPVVAFCASAWLTATTIASLGSPWWVNVTVSVVAMLCTALCVLDNFSAEAPAYEMIKRCSELQGQLECDPLTGLMNRSAFNKALTNLRANVSESVEVMVLF